MGDSPLEELEAHEHAEHAQHAAHGNNPLVSQVTLTIAVMAVIAAVGASLETTEGDRTIIAKNEAVLEQNRATDKWNEYQAQSLKEKMYAIAGDQAPARAADYGAKSKGYATAKIKLMAEAKELEEKRDGFSEEAEVHERRHGRLTIASTLLHMAIAIATLAIILGKRWPWLTALALTAAGLGLGAWAYL